MINQLRLYDFDPALRGAFLDRFRDHASRIMRRHGFRILAMWTAESADRLRFVYLLSWADEAEMRARWAAFMADAEWTEVKRRTQAAHGEPVRAIEDIVLDPVDFSAALGEVRA